MMPDATAEGLIYQQKYKMLRLNLPPFPFKIVRNESNVTIFDPLRKKYVALTPEEWVRQHFVQYLIKERGFPGALIANEVSIKLHRTSKRCDTVVYDNQLTPLALVEYKAPEVEITQKVFEQISRYNIVFKVPYLIISNGLSHYCCQIDYENQRISFLKEIPTYQEIIQNK